MNVVEPDNSEKSDLEILKALGYDTAGIIEQEKYYMLHPDIIISKSRIEEYRNAPQTRLTKTLGGFLNDTYQTVLINDKYLSYFKDELHQAMEAWNNIGSCGLKFIIDNSAYDAVEMYAENDGDGNDPISCELPDKGKHGKYARINLSKFGYNAANLAKGMMMHVLGHIVGFGHTPSEYTANPPSNHIAGTAESDPNSIMRTEADAMKGMNIWSGFTNSDKNGIRKVYPLKTATKLITCKLGAKTITGADLALYETYEITVKYEHPSCLNPSYVISIDAIGGYELKQKQNGVVTVRFTKGGYFTLCVEVINTREKVRFEKQYKLPNPQPAVTSITCSPGGEGPSGTDLKLYKAYQFTASYSHISCPEPVYDISIRQSSGYTLTKNPTKHEKATVEFSAPGTYDVVVKISNASVSATFEKKYTVSEPERVRISGPSEIRLAEFYNFTLSSDAPEVPDPEFDITVKETCFNDPKYTLTRNSNRDFSILFDDAGFYTIEASVKGRPEIMIGKYDISLFPHPPYKLGERILANDKNELWEYSTIMTVYSMKTPTLVCIEYRTIIYAHVKYEAYAIVSGKRNKLDTFQVPDGGEIKTIIKEKGASGYVDLPSLRDVKPEKPIPGRNLIFVPYYSGITFPENFAREYNPWGKL